ncbi:uncharacterized protein MELLADRAFT_71562 [Melampsora larici-populina 98AG31]|uniref:Uncharacterized protein n=1 Tax=Melampsora larici-populina (strain 98AG31 / pathotype 3-4-7) TaxID=747676 RepID=F4RHW3_MELLP|nr:uncharacterized protein MELLADRAFT_71562 [Melampsora larici-populina 98AG31]EGG08063.1 hypothetical protein MELLADRAFT_71562 [Melampsora larici-populina 98AG31]
MSQVILSRVMNFLNHLRPQVNPYRETANYLVTLFQVRYHIPRNLDRFLGNVYGRPLFIRP